MTVWFKGAEMGTLYCSPYLKLYICRSNPGSRIHPSRPWLLFSKQYLFFLSFYSSPYSTKLDDHFIASLRFLKCVQVINKNAGTSFKASLGQLIKTIPMQGDISYHAAFQVGSKNINAKSKKLTFFLFNLLETFSSARAIYLESSKIRP